ncbi:hypothetical protein E2C01_102167 [Portunus trituberculatus]|uniref:Uncharacterized protein n=1 Tax=Portunus trituberculatus TaxID=210409 RepID=A0A5B7KM53_PORTR|nr:hypothetical protein [Portunus trituberculatus]
MIPSGNRCPPGNSLEFIKIDLRARQGLIYSTLHTLHSHPALESEANCSLSLKILSDLSNGRRGREDTFQSPLSYVCVCNSPRLPAGHPAMQSSPLRSELRAHTPVFG